MGFFVEISIPIIPQPKRRVRAAISNGRVMTYQDKKSRKYERDVCLFLKPYAPRKPMTGPVDINIRFIHPRPKNMMGNRFSDGLCWKATRPDCDNLAKSISDSLQLARFFNDDGQIVRMAISDQYAEKEGKARVILSVGDLLEAQPNC